MDSLNYIFDVSKTKVLLSDFWELCMLNRGFCFQSRFFGVCKF